MNIVFVTDSARLDGGISQVAIQAASALARRGHTVYYFCAEGPADPLLSEVVPPERIVIHATEHILTDKNRVRAAVKGIANHAAGAAVSTLLKRFDASDTVVHLHGWCKNLSPQVVRDVVDSGLPAVQTLHEYFMVCPNGAFYNFQENSICLRRPLSVSCVTCHCDSRSYAHKLWRVARSAYQKYKLGLPDARLAYITNSPLCRRVFTTQLPAGARIFDVNNPIGVEFGPRSRVEDNRSLLFVGRFSREKGVLELAKAVGELGLPAIFVGDGHLREEMQRLAPQATFTGWLAREDVYKQMRHARALVFPSTWYETQGLVTVEAAAVGLPAIISDCTAACDFLPDRTRAIHFKHDSAEALKAALCRLNDDASVRGLSQAAYDWYWSAPWTPQKHATDLEAVYRSLVVTPSARVPESALSA